LNNSRPLSPCFMIRFNFASNRIGAGPVWPHCRDVIFTNMNFIFDLQS
jgi:hypothetical protein